MRSRSRPCRRPALRLLQPPRRPRCLQQRKSTPIQVAVAPADGMWNVTSQQRLIMTPGGIHTPAAISAPHPTKSLSPPRRPVRRSRRVFLLCAKTAASDHQALPAVSPPSDPSDTCRWQRRSNPYLVGHVIQTRAIGDSPASVKLDRRRLFYRLVVWPLSPWRARSG